MRQTVRPAGRLSGLVTLPGDKSISHRYAMIASLAEGASKIHELFDRRGLPFDARLRARAGNRGRRSRARPSRFTAADSMAGSSRQRDLDAGNSGSTIRMMSGLLAAQPFTSRIFGDESLSRRPMDRIMKPLAADGRADRSARESVSAAGDSRRRTCIAIDYTLPVPSAQVKTCVLFGGLVRRRATRSCASRCARAITPRSRCASSAPTCR